MVLQTHMGVMNSDKLEGAGSINTYFKVVENDLLVYVWFEIVS